MDMILIWLSGALFFGYIFKVLSLPILIGFITSGYFFSYINFSDNNEILSIPSKIGVELLLFSIGLKVKPSSFLSLSFLNVFFLHSLLITFPLVIKILTKPLFSEFFLTILFNI